MTSPSSPSLLENDQGSVTEDDSILSTSGTLSSSDIDQNSTASWSIDGSEVGTYGSISVDQYGSWTYTLDNGSDGQSSVVQDLNQGDSVTDSFTVVVTDDNGATDSQTVVVTINGSNDEPVLSFSSGNDQGSVTEDSILSTSGTLSSSDIDQNSTATWSIDGSGLGTYGSISVDQYGSWTYTLDNGIDGSPQSFKTSMKVTPSPIHSPSSLPTTTVQQTLRPLSSPSTAPMTSPSSPSLLEKIKAPSQKTTAS